MIIINVNNYYKQFNSYIIISFKYNISIILLKIN